MKLKGCPFCGGNGKMENENTSWYVECEQCHVESSYYDSKEEAADAWNFRVGDEDLKPCPFCGGDAQIEETNEEDNAYYVHCTLCGADGPVLEDKIKAMKSWNEVPRRKE